MPSLRLRTEPTLAQTEVILARIERELGRLGARLTRGHRGELRFRMPLPWSAPRWSFLLLIGSGHVRLSAGGGGPRRLRYHLHFVALYALGAIVTAGLLLLGWRWPQRILLINEIVAVWGLVALLVVGTRRRFRLLLARCAREIIERRSTPREGSTPVGIGATPAGDRPPGRGDG